MTNRIDKLIAQCTHTATDYSLGIDSSEEVFDKQAFAKLLIAHCIEVITDLPNRMVGMELSPYNEGWRNGRLLAKEHIEDYFGTTPVEPKVVTLDDAEPLDAITEFTRAL